MSQSRAAQRKAAEREQRLKALPGPAGPLLRKLFKQGLLTAHMTGVALDAAELATRPRDILPFMVAQHALRARQVPVKRIFALAKRFGQRIDLLAPVDEWYRIQERLWLAVALKEHTDREVYKTGAVEALLPARWPGYLIRTSRRWGMVRLRLHLTNAWGFYWGLKNDCALATVFVDGQRWALALGADGTGDKPALRIHRIVTNVERRPTEPERLAVYAALGLTPRSHAEPRRAAHELDPQLDPLYRVNLRHLLAVLRRLAVARVSVAETADWQRREENAIDIVGVSGASLDGAIRNEKMSVEAEEYDALDDGWVFRRAPREATVAHTIESIVREYSHDTGVNWRCHRNGSRKVEIDVARGTITMTLRTRLTGPPAFHRHMDIGTGQEVEPASPKAA